MGWTRAVLIGGGMMLGLLAAGCSEEGTPPPIDNAKVPVAQPLTANDDVFEANPTYSPDGNWILFESDADGNRDIWRLPAGGGAAEQLTFDPAFDSSPAWAPDGGRIVFESDRGGYKHIWILDLTTGSAVPTPLTSGDWDDGSPVWSPDGARIAYESSRAKSGGTDLWVSPAAGGAALRLTVTGDDVYHRSADWSPDGAELVFESDREEDQSALYVIDALGGVPHRITPIFGYEGHPAWSPDGQQIAYEGSVDGTIEILVVAPSGGPSLQVTTAGGFWPTWSPDGKSLVFGVFGDPEPNLWSLEVNW